MSLFVVAVDAYFIGIVNIGKAEGEDKDKK